MQGASLRGSESRACWDKARWGRDAINGVNTTSVGDLARAFWVNGSVLVGLRLETLRIRLGLLDERRLDGVVECIEGLLARQQPDRSRAIRSVEVQRGPRTLRRRDDGFLLNDLNGEDVLGELARRMMRVCETLAIRRQFGIENLLQYFPCSTICGCLRCSDR